MGQFCQDRPTCIISIDILRVQRRHDIQRMIQPFIIPLRHHILPEHLHDAEPDNVGSEVLMPQQSHAQDLPLRKKPEAFQSLKLLVMSLIKFDLETHKGCQESSNNKTT